MRISMIFVLLMIVLGGFWQTSYAQAPVCDSTALSGEMPTSGLLNFRVSPNGSYVIYMGQDAAPGTRELYSVPYGGGTPTRLNPSPTNGVDNNFHITDTRVVFVSDFNLITFTGQLYSTLIDGSAAPIPIAAGATGFNTRISPDGSRIVYLSEQAGVNELYSVPITGGTATKLSPALVANGDVLNLYGITPDGNWVVYSADQDVDGRMELYSVPITGGTVNQLNTDVGYSLIIASIEITPDSQHVVVVMDQTSPSTNEIYSIPIDGSAAPTRLVNTPPGERVFNFYAISPDSTYVAFAMGANPGIAFPYLAQIGVNGAAQIGTNFPIIGVGELQISPDSNYLVYAANLSAGVTELFSAPISVPGTATRLNSTPLPFGGEVEMYVITSDSARVIYNAEQNIDNQIELYSVPIGGGSPITLANALPDSQDISEIRLSDDGSRLIYWTADPAAPFTRRELFAMSPAGGTLTKISGVMTTGGSVEWLELSSGSGRVAYFADQDQNEVYQLYPECTIIIPPVVVTPESQPAPAQEVAAAPALTFIIKTVDKTVAQVGDSLTYTITFTNPKGNPLRQVVVSDIFDSRLDQVQVVSTSLGNAILNGNTLTIQNLELLPGQQVRVVVQARISSRARAGDRIQNIASLESPDASIHFSNTVETLILPSTLPSTGESPWWRLAGLMLLIVLGGRMLMRVTDT